MPQEENIVDGEAEEFIRRFYEQLQAQNRIALLEYQEREYQNMLAWEACMTLYICMYINVCIKIIWCSLISGCMTIRFFKYISLDLNWLWYFHLHMVCRWRLLPVMCMFMFPAMHHDHFYYVEWCISLDFIIKLAWSLCFL